MNNEDNDKLIELLPWYVNNTLSAEERAKVEQLLEESSEAREELAVLRKLRDTVKQDDDLYFSGQEMGWRRLQKQIQQSQQVNNISSQEAFSWKRVVSIAAVLVICVQTALLFNTHQQLDNATQLLSGDPAYTSIPSSEDVLWLQVQFSNNANWEQINAALQDVEGEIVDGPSALGLVSVRVILDKDRGATKEVVVDRLLASSVVDHVQFSPAE